MNPMTVLVIVGIVLLLLVLKQAGQVREDEALSLLRKGARVVDVRTSQEYRGGQVPGAINVPLGEIQMRAAAEFPGKGDPILLHCASGARSGVARRILRGLGYTNVHNLGSFSRARTIVARGEGGT